MTSGAILSFLIIIMNILFAMTVIFLERRNVIVTWAWLLVLLFLPGVGFVAIFILRTKPQQAQNLQAN